MASRKQREQSICLCGMNTKSRKQNYLVVLLESAMLQGGGLQKEGEMLQKRILGHIKVKTKKVY
jgi:hypothetical protein